MRKKKGLITNGFPPPQSRIQLHTANAIISEGGKGRASLFNNTCGISDNCRAFGNIANDDCACANSAPATNFNSLNNTSANTYVRAFSNSYA